MFFDSLKHVEESASTTAISKDALGGGKQLGEHNNILRNLSSLAPYIYPIFHSDGSPDEDDNGHGSHVAGTVAGAFSGVAKKANIIAVKVLDADGHGM